MNSLLARFAENNYWMARYMERTENLARILDVNESFAWDSGGVRDWLPVVQLHADEARFGAVHAEATAEAVAQFYVLDRQNPNSIVSMIGTARESARSMRHLISTEMWTQLNVFYNRIANLRARDVRLSQLSALCATVKLDCQLHTGIIEGTYHRDEGWIFYHIGKSLERADETTRLLDIKLHRLVGASHAESFADVSQWNALLRSVAGYHAFRRIHPSGIAAAEVAGFLLFNPAFPRAVIVCLAEVDELLLALERQHRMNGATVVREALAPLAAAVESAAGDAINLGGLRDFLDSVQSRINIVGNAMKDAFFEQRR